MVREAEAKAGATIAWGQKSLSSKGSLRMSIVIYISFVMHALKQSGLERKTRSQDLKERSIFLISAFAMSALIWKVKRAIKIKCKKQLRWGHPFAKLPMTQIKLHLTHLFSKILLIWVPLLLSCHLQHSQSVVGFRVSHHYIKISRNLLLIKVVF